MPIVTVLAFGTSHGAEEALVDIERLRAHGALELGDAALVSWPAGHRTPSSAPAAGVVTTRSLGGMFWGALFGLIFFAPLIGTPVPSRARSSLATGALGVLFAECGIDERFIGRVREVVTPGRSALFLITAAAVADRLAGTTPADLDVVATG